MKEMKGRCKTGRVQQSEDLWPQRCQLSPAWSRTQPSFEQQVGLGNQPCSRLPTGTVWGKPSGVGMGVRRGKQPQPSPSQAGKPPGEGEATWQDKAHSCCRWEGEWHGAQQGRAGWRGHVGPGQKAMGAEQGAHGRPFIPGARQHCLRRCRCGTHVGTRQCWAAGGAAKVSLLP